jgi:hypothetical protein
MWLSLLEDKSRETVQRVQITESMSLLVFRIDGESGS